MNATLRAVALASALAAAGTAHAQLFRAYLASNGLDTNACTLPAPCRLLPAALAAVANGGEVWMLDSANYNTGPVNVTKSVTILAVPGALASLVATAGDAVQISTPSARVTLRNLSIGPLPGTTGGAGIRMTSGQALTVDGCVIANLSSTAIYVATAAAVRVVASTLRNNSEGVYIAGGAKATVVGSSISGHVNFAVVGDAGGAGTTVDVASSTLDSNDVGAFAYSSSAGATVKVSVRDSHVVRNNVGLLVENFSTGSAFMSASDNIVSNNVQSGIAAILAGAAVWASGNTVTGNGEYGLQNDNGAVFETAGNNLVRGNGLGNTIGTITPAGKL